MEKIKENDFLAIWGKKPDMPIIPEKMSVVRKSRIL